MRPGGTLSFSPRSRNAVALAGLDMRMFYGGPSEAVMHSIYRQTWSDGTC